MLLLVNWAHEHKSENKNKRNCRCKNNANIKTLIIVKYCYAKKILSFGKRLTLTDKLIKKEKIECEPYVIISNAYL